ncbi:hypothetical protein GLYMA_05G085950v4 [Glycine max]|nr:hypothetical protein GLYMA_05G085950v4 [Glycine max]KAH1133532.1 hypothetical protein GYH30_012078 [Glycine max]
MELRFLVVIVTNFVLPLVDADDLPCTRLKSHKTCL